MFRVNTADPVHFTLTPPECHMEIKQGYGTSGNRVTGPVHVGDPLTLLIYMRSQWGKVVIKKDAYITKIEFLRLYYFNYYFT